jgi:hypothetical protein
VPKPVTAVLRDFSKMLAPPLASPFFPEKDAVPTRRTFPSPQSYFSALGRRIQLAYSMALSPSIVNPVPQPSTVNDVFHALTENNIIQWLMFGFGLPTSLWIFYKGLKRVLALHCTLTMANMRPSAFYCGCWPPILLSALY